MITHQVISHIRDDLVWLEGIARTGEIRAKHWPRQFYIAKYP